MENEAILMGRREQDESYLTTSSLPIYINPGTQIIVLQHNHEQLNNSFTQRKV